MKRFSLRACLLYVSLGAGIVFDQGHAYTFLVRYTLMAMLFLSLLGCRVSGKMLLQPRLWQLLGAMGGIAIATYGLFRLASPDLALIAFLLAVTPTATAAPVVTHFLQGRVDYVTASVLLTNGLMAIAIPLLMPLLGDSNASLGQILNATLVVIIGPLALSQLLQHTAPGLAQKLSRYQNVSFYLWLAALYLAAAKASHFIRYESDGPQIVAEMALVALVLCVLNFGLGRWLGGSLLAQETSQALGQKNTVFAIWFCLTFLGPHLALGPMFYILFQNLYNSYLMTQISQEDRVPSDQR